MNAHIKVVFHGSVYGEEVRVQYRHDIGVVTINNVTLNYSTWEEINETLEEVRAEEIEEEKKVTGVSYMETGTLVRSSMQSKFHVMKTGSNQWLTTSGSLWDDRYVGYLLDTGWTVVKK